VETTPQPPGISNDEWAKALYASTRKVLENRVRS
jgi:hypothetical protein